MAASYLAKSRGSGEPEASVARCKDLEHFIRDCRSFVLDKGHHTGDQYDGMVLGFRRRLEEVLGNTSGAVADTVKKAPVKGRKVRARRDFGEEVAPDHPLPRASGQTTFRSIILGNGAAGIDLDDPKRKLVQLTFAQAVEVSPVRNSVEQDDLSGSPAKRPAALRPEMRTNSAGVAGLIIPWN